MSNAFKVPLNTQTVCFFVPIGVCRTHTSTSEKSLLMIRYYPAPFLEGSGPFSLTLVSRYCHLSSCVIHVSLKVALRVVRVIMTFNLCLEDTIRSHILLHYLHTFTDILSMPSASQSAEIPKNARQMIKLKLADEHLLLSSTCESCRWH